MAWSENRKIKVSLKIWCWLLLDFYFNGLKIKCGLFQYSIIENYTNVDIRLVFIELHLRSDNSFDRGIFKDKTSQFLSLGNISDNLDALSHWQNIIF